MADNAQKLSLGAKLSARAVAATLNHIQNLAGRAPVTIVSMDKTNTIATVKFETDGTYTLPNVTIPVHGPEYTRWPLKKGDKGVVGAFDLDVGNMTGLGDQNPASFTRPGNLASLCFHPLGNKNFTPTDDPKKHVNYGASGTIARDESKKSQVSTDSTAGAQIAGGGDGQGNFDHTSTAHPDGVTHKSKTKVTTDAPTHDVTQDQSVGGNHAVGGNSTTAGAVTGKTGSFPDGLSGGGLSMLLGIIKGVGGGGGVTSASLAPGAAQANILAPAGLPVYPDPATARAALGANAFYVDSGLGAEPPSTATSTSGGSGSGGSSTTTTTTIPGRPSFYAQGFLVVCTTGAT